MKATKKTQVPLPGSKAKVKTSLSQEFIGSDDDDSSTEKRAPSATKPQPKTTIAVHRPNGAATSKAKPSTKESSTQKPKAPAAAKIAPKKATPKQVVTQAQAAELSSSEQSDDDAPARDIQTKLPGNKGRASESDSDSDSDSSSEESEDAPSQPAPAPDHASSRSSQAQPHAVEFRPAQPYIAPKGFNAVPCNDKTISQAARVFDNLEGKQIWHITAPAGVSISDLKEMTMEHVDNGEAVLQHKGTSYGFSGTELSNGGSICKVLVPHKNGYKAVSKPIAQSLRLRADVKLPHLSSKQADVNTGSEAASSITRSTIRAPRPQLKGLKMRFLPTGFGAGDVGTLGDSDSEGEAPQATAGLGMPDELNLPSRKEKRKHTALNGDEGTGSQSKKHKKQRTTEEAQRKEERRAKKEKKRAQQAAATKS